MLDQPVMNDEEKGKTPSRCTAPAAGCFGQLHATEAYGGIPRRSAGDVAHDWDSVARHFYALGYRNGGK